MTFAYPAPGFLLLRGRNQQMKCANCRKKYACVTEKTPLCPRCQKKGKK